MGRSTSIDPEILRSPACIWCTNLYPWGQSHRWIAVGQVPDPEPLWKWTGSSSSITDVLREIDRYAIQPEDKFFMVTLPVWWWRSFQVYLRNLFIAGNHVQIQDSAKYYLCSFSNVCLSACSFFFPFLFYLWAIVRGICMLSCSVTCDVNLFFLTFFYFVEDRKSVV